MAIRAKKGFVLRKIGAQYMAVPFGAMTGKVKGMITLTESGYFLWKTLETGVENVDALVDAMIAEYDVDRETAAKDVCVFLMYLAELGVIDDGV